MKSKYHLLQDTTKSLYRLLQLRRYMKSKWKLECTYLGINQVNQLND